MIINIKLVCLSSGIPKAYADKMIVGGVHYDQKNGAGASKTSDDILYYGFVAYMKASVFLSLCDMDGASKIDADTKGLVHYIKDGGSIASPLLSYNTEQDAITSHDGRHRAMATIQCFGDIVMPIHIKLEGGLRGKSVCREMVDAFNEYVRSENGSIVTQAIQAYYSTSEKFVTV